MFFHHTPETLRYEAMMQCWKEEPSHRPEFTDLKLTLEVLLDDETVSK